MLTQIIASDSLTRLGRLVHEIRELWNIEQCCNCPLSKEVSQKCNGSRKEIIKSILSIESNGIKREFNEDDFKHLFNGSSPVKDEKTPLSWLVDVALCSEDKNDSSSDSGGEEKYSTLRDLLMQKQNGNQTSPANNSPKPKKSVSKLNTLDDVISNVIEDSVPKREEKEEKPFEVKPDLKHFVRRYNWERKGFRPYPIRIMTLMESKDLYPDTPHSWLCDGELLRLSDPTHKGNLKIFQVREQYSNMILVKNVLQFHYYQLDADFEH